MQLNKEEIQAAIDEQITAAEKQYGKGIKFILINIIGLFKMLNPEQPEKKSRLIPLSQWNDFHLYPTVGSLYQYNFNRENNGFDYCVIRSGKRILIDEDKLFEWLQNRKISA